MEREIARSATSGVGMDVGRSSVRDTERERLCREEAVGARDSVCVISVGSVSTAPLKGVWSLKEVYTTAWYDVREECRLEGC